MLAERRPGNPNLRKHHEQGLNSCFVQICSRLLTGEEWVSSCRKERLFSKETDSFSLQHRPHYICPLWQLHTPGSFYASCRLVYMTYYNIQRTSLATYYSRKCQLLYSAHGLFEGQESIVMARRQCHCPQSDDGSWTSLKLTSLRDANGVTAVSVFTK